MLILLECIFQHLSYFILLIKIAETRYYKVKVKEIYGEKEMIWITAKLILKTNQDYIFDLGFNSNNSKYLTNKENYDYRYVIKGNNINNSDIVFPMNKSDNLFVPSKIIEYSYLFNYNFDNWEIIVSNAPVLLIRKKGGDICFIDSKLWLNLSKHIVKIDFSSFVFKSFSKISGNKFKRHYKYKKW